MAYDAPRTAREIVLSICTNEYADILAQVALEHGVKVTAPKSIYRAKNAKQAVANSLEIRPVDTPRIADSSSGVVVSEVEMWVVATAQGGDPVALDLEAEAHHCALVRTFIGREGDTPLAAWSISVVEGSTSPPGKTGTATIQSAGVRLCVKVAEAR